MQARSYFAFIIIVAIACLMGTFTNAQEATDSDSRNELNRLLTKRRDVLLQRVDVLEKKTVTGTGAGRFGRYGA